MVGLLEIEVMIFAGCERFGLVDEVVFIFLWIWFLGCFLKVEFCLCVK